MISSRGYFIRKYPDKVTEKYNREIQFHIIKKSILIIDKMQSVILMAYNILRITYYILDLVLIQTTKYVETISSSFDTL
jgi:hypothetical protein